MSKPRRYNPEWVKGLEDDIRVSVGEDTILLDPVCNVCLDLKLDAVKTTCSHSFCSSCIGEWLSQRKTCPNCRAPQQGSAGLVPHEALRKAIDELPAACPHCALGGTLQAVAVHEMVCPDRPPCTCSICAGSQCRDLAAYLRALASQPAPPGLELVVVTRRIPGKDYFFVARKGAPKGQASNAFVHVSTFAAIVDALRAKYDCENAIPVTVPPPVGIEFWAFLGHAVDNRFRLLLQTTLAMLSREVYRPEPVAWEPVPNVAPVVVFNTMASIDLVMGYTESAEPEFD